MGRSDFLHVADSKLCSKEAMSHIASHQGRFVTIVPYGRKEDTWFRNWGPDPRPELGGGRTPPRPTPR